MSIFHLDSHYKPTGDQPQAIRQLVEGVNGHERNQVLLGVTGSGKTFTMANVIRNVNRPTLVLSHNKTLAAQLYAEFKGFFPDNAVEYFVSYFDYYQPEAYIPRTDTFIEKDSSVNEEIERMRRRSGGWMMKKSFCERTKSSKNFQQAASHSSVRFSQSRTTNPIPILLAAYPKTQINIAG